jgi:large subunit ribosomal protein L33
MFFCGSILYEDGVCLFFVFKTETVLREVKLMRTKITMACVDCKQRNYEMMKEKKNHPDRMETKKHCKFCNKHTVHRETK